MLHKSCLTRICNCQDYMLFDPFINGAADLHDRHRDMRLDVDNMSYEVNVKFCFFVIYILSWYELVIHIFVKYVSCYQELLALEERIGDVKTGLTVEEILKLMKQRKHFSFVALSPQNLEPCCICRVRFIS